MKNLIFLKIASNYSILYLLLLIVSCQNQNGQKASAVSNKEDERMEQFVLKVFHTNRCKIFYDSYSENFVVPSKIKSEKCEQLFLISDGVFKFKDQKLGVLIEKKVDDCLFHFDSEICWIETKGYGKFEVNFKQKTLLHILTHYNDDLIRDQADFYTSTSGILQVDGKEFQL